MSQKIAKKYHANGAFIDMIRRKLLFRLALLNQYAVAHKCAMEFF